MLVILGSRDPVEMGKGGGDQVSLVWRKRQTRGQAAVGTLGGPTRGVFESHVGEPEGGRVTQLDWEGVWDPGEGSRPRKAGLYRKDAGGEGLELEGGWEFHKERKEPVFSWRRRLGFAAWGSPGRKRHSQNPHTRMDRKVCFGRSQGIRWNLEGPGIWRGGEMPGPGRPG